MVLWLMPLACGCGARSTLDVPLDGGCGRETMSMQVPSTTPWFDTGIEVTAGQHLHITATGTVRYGGDAKQVTEANGGHHTGKKFFPAAVLPTTVVCSLIGKVGGTAAVGTGTLLLEGTPDDGPGFVGTSYDEIVPESGRAVSWLQRSEASFRRQQRRVQRHHHADLLMRLERGAAGFGTYSQSRARARARNRAKIEHEHEHDGMAAVLA